MPEDADESLSVDEFVEYCQTQAGLLRGRVDTMREDVGELLDEIDEEIETAQSALDEHAVGSTEGTASPDAPGSPPGADDVAELESLKDDLEEKQAVVEAEQARMIAYQELAVAYADLAEDLQSEVADGQEALRRVVEFEVDEDAPAYFEERKTMAEAAAEANE